MTTSQTSQSPDVQPQQVSEPQQITTSQVPQATTSQTSQLPDVQSQQVPVNQPSQVPQVVQAPQTTTPQPDVQTISQASGSQQTTTTTPQSSI